MFHLKEFGDSNCGLLHSIRSWSGYFQWIDDKKTRSGLLCKLKEVEGRINKILKVSDSRIHSSIQKLVSGKEKMDFEGSELIVDLISKDNNQKEEEKMT